MKNQSSIEGFINSNLLDIFYISGGVLQSSEDEFLIFLGIDNQNDQIAAVDLIHFGFEKAEFYHPDFWEFTQYIDNLSSNFDLQKKMDLRGQDVWTMTLSLLNFKTLLNCLVNFKKSNHNETEQLIDFANNLDSTGQTNLKLIQAKKNEFFEQFNWSQEQFLKGHLNKTVPMTEFEFAPETQMTRENYWQLMLFSIESVRQNSTNVFLYAVWNQNELMVGQTPELLARYSNSQIETVALAGTWSNEDNVKSIEQVSLKIQQEHQFVIDDILQQIAKVNFNLQSTIKVGATQILKLKLLSHLKTSIHIQNVQRDEYKKLLCNLHPTAALGLFPRSAQEFVEFSKLFLQQSRKKFGSPFAVIKNNQALAVVAIRQWQINLESQLIRIPVGCGITIDSIYEDEWQELELKSRNILKMFNFHKLNE